MNVSQDQAIITLQKLIDEINSLKKNKAFSEPHTRWLTNVLAITEELFGQRSRIYLSIAGLPWQRRGSFIIDPLIHGTMDYNKVVEQFHHEAYLEQLDTAKGLLQAGIVAVNNYWTLDKS